MTTCKYIIIMGVVFGLSNFSHALDAKKVIQKAKKKYSETKTITASFTQQFQWKLAGESQEQDGQLWLAKGDKFKIQTVDQTIVADGKTIWTYSRANNQVIVNSLDVNENGMLPNEIFVKYTEEYRPVRMTEEPVNGNSCYKVLLVSKSDNTFIKEMNVWIDKEIWIARKIQHKDINDNMTSYILSEIRLDELFSSDVFKFKPTPGVDVVDMR